MITLFVFWNTLKRSSYSITRANQKTFVLPSGFVWRVVEERGWVTEEGVDEYLRRIRAQGGAGEQKNIPLGGASVQIYVRLQGVFARRIRQHVLILFVKFFV